MYPKRTLRRGRVGLLLFLATAMVLAWGAAGTAAGLLTGRSIQDDTVTGRDLRDATVTSIDVRDGSLAPPDYTGAVLGAPGPQGPSGPAGPAGPQGPAGVPRIERVTVSVDAVPPRHWRGGVARCPIGTRALSGGVGFLDPAADAWIMETAPVNDPSGWHGYFHNQGNSDLTGYIWAVCARV